jgi:hypothetical protein
MDEIQIYRTLTKILDRSVQNRSKPRVDIVTQVSDNF